MSFSYSFSDCMSPLQTPSGLLDSAAEVFHVLDELHTAWEAAGVDEETTIAAIVAFCAASGIDEAALAILGEVAADPATTTVAAYIAACLACLVTAAASSIWDSIASSDTPGCRVS